MYPKATEFLARDHIDELHRQAARERRVKAVDPSDRPDDREPARAVAPERAAGPAVRIGRWFRRAIAV